MTSIKRRPGRRIYLILFAVVLYFLCHQFLPAPWWPRISPITTSTSDIKYISSSKDWSQARLFFPVPVEDLKPLPRGASKKLPKVQSPRRGASPRQDATAAARRRIIKSKALKSWEAYKKHAWTRDELMPLSAKGKQTLSGWSAQIVDALDTLWILDLKDEFRQAVRQVAVTDFARATGGAIDVFEVTIRYLGGLIGAYELSKEPVLLSKAIELGDLLYAAFDTPNRLPTAWLDLRDAKKGRQAAAESISSSVGASLCLEFTRLSQLTGDPKYYDATERVKQFLRRTQGRTRVPGLWPRVLNFRDETADETLFTFAAGADSLYEYLPKMYALLGGLDPEYKKMAVQALDVAKDKLLFRPLTPDGDDILMAGNLVSSRQEYSRSYEMQHLTCFAGGMYALAGKLFSRRDFVDAGSRLTAGCVWAYDSFATRIMPEISELLPCASLKGPCDTLSAVLPGGPQDNLPPGFIRVRDPRYSLRPEAIESVFYMWRITGEQTWRDSAWRMWEAIVKEAETELAFASLADVNVIGGAKIDAMDTFWLSETLKYFYLIFDDEDTLSLDDWVFNTEAHPFRRPGPFQE